MEHRIEPRTSELTAVMNRLEKLEKQNRRFKQIGALALILLGSVFLMGQASPPRTVEANEFVLKDGSGIVRGKWGITNDGAYQILNDASGKQRVLLFAEPNNTSLQLLDREGFGTIVGTGVSVTRTTGETRKTSAANIAINDKDKKVLWKAP